MEEKQKSCCWGYNRFAPHLKFSVDLKKNVFAVHGLYDGKRVKISEPVNKNKKYRVVVTFLEELPDEEQEIREFASRTESFDFWENTAEEIYQDCISQKKGQKMTIGQNILIPFPFAEVNQKKFVPVVIIR